MADVMTIVTDRIIAALEKGCVPWRKPWHSSGRGAYNRITGKQYSLLNQMMLAHEGEYASFKQWTALGGKVKKGSKSEIVVFWKWPEDIQKEEDPDDSDIQENKKKKGPVLRYYPVFHISQVEDVEPLKRTETTYFKHDPIEEAEIVLTHYVSRESIKYDAGEYAEAYYSPKWDLIHVPCLRLYENPEEYYGTAFHEAIHSTGAEHRLKRDGIKRIRFGSESYGREELVAEIGSAYIMSILGMETDNSFNNSASYIQNWLSALKNDRRMIVVAAGQAQKAANFIFGN